MNWYSNAQLHWKWICIRIGGRIPTLLASSWQLVLSEFHYFVTKPHHSEVVGRSLCNSEQTPPQVEVLNVVAFRLRKINWASVWRQDEVCPSG